MGLKSWSGFSEYPQAIDMAIEALSAKSEQTIRHIENNTKESDLVYRPSADDTFCKSQLITCNRIKECNGVCPFEDALKHADKMQTMDEQHTVDHDRDWIIGCIEHDGFIHTHRFDKANQIIHDALLADTSSDLISRANAIRWVKTECNPYGKPTLDYDSGLKVIEHLKKMPSELPSAEARWIPCSERLPKRDELVLVTYKTTDRIHLCKYLDDGSENPWWSYIDDCCAWNNVVLAWMPLPKPYREDGEA